MSTAKRGAQRSAAAAGRPPAQGRNIALGLAAAPKVTNVSAE